jgi:hypothetical protein
MNSIMTTEETRKWHGLAESLLNMGMPPPDVCEKLVSCGMERTAAKALVNDIRERRWQTKHQAKVEADYAARSAADARKASGSFSGGFGFAIACGAGAVMDFFRGYQVTVASAIGANLLLLGVSFISALASGERRRGIHAGVAVNFVVILCVLWSK